MRFWDRLREVRLRRPQKTPSGIVVRRLLDTFRVSSAAAAVKPLGSWSSALSLASTWHVATSVSHPRHSFRLRAFPQLDLSWKATCESEYHVLPQCAPCMRMLLCRCFNCMICFTGTPAAPLFPLNMPHSPPSTRL
jgi:hypothetical protein